MNSKTITYTQSLFIFILFQFGSSVVMGVNSEVAQDTWLAIIFAAIASVPLLILYGRILRLFPGKGLFEILETVFGKVISRILAVFFTWYSLHLTALVLRNFSEFINISTMPETPQLAIMILMILTIIYLARSGIHTLGKWVIPAFILVMGVVLVTFLASTPLIKLSNFEPFFAHSPKEFTHTSFQIFSFPYMESVIFLYIGGGFSKKNNPYSLLLYTILISAIVFISITIRNNSLIGAPSIEKEYFPSYVAVGTISIGNFISRIEGSISSNFIIAGIAKITICLLATSKGIAFLFNAPDYRPLIFPVGMVSLGLCSILYTDVMEMTGFFQFYPFYAFPFQVILPVATWIGAEIYTKRKTKSPSKAIPQ